MSIFSLSPDKTGFIDKSRKNWKEHLEIKPENTIKEWIQDTNKSPKQTNLVRSDSFVTLHSPRGTFTRDIKLNLTNAGPHGIIKVQFQKLQHVMQLITKKLTYPKNRKS